MAHSYSWPWGLSTWLYAEDGGLAALEKLAADGVEHVELWANTCQFDPRVSPPDPRTVKQKLNELHLNPHSLHTPFSAFDGQLGMEERKQTWLIETQKSLHYAAMVGAEIAVVHPIFFTQRPGEEMVVNDCGEDLLREVIRYARTQGVRIALENMRRQRTTQFAHTAQLRSLIERLGDDTVGICLDPGHALSSGADLSQEVHDAGELLITLHVNDNRQGDHDLHLVPGEGEIDWEQFVKDLKDIRYNSVFLLELSGRSGPSQVLQKTRVFLERYLGNRGEG